MDFRELMNEEAFAKKLEGAQSVEELKEIFTAEGLKFDEETLLRQFMPNGDELNENDLEAVSGGMIVSNLLRRLLQSNRGRSSGGGGKGAFGGGAPGGGIR